LATIVVVAGAYYAAGKLGLRLAFVNPSSTPVWPPAGIALARAGYFHSFSVEPTTELEEPECFGEILCLGGDSNPMIFRPLDPEVEVHQRWSLAYGPPMGR
jgi:hypothetical protein